MEYRSKDGRNGDPGKGKDQLSVRDTERVVKKGNT